MKQVGTYSRGLNWIRFFSSVCALAMLVSLESMFPDYSVHWRSANKAENFILKILGTLFLRNFSSTSQFPRPTSTDQTMTSELNQKLSKKGAAQPSSSVPTSDEAPLQLPGVVSLYQPGTREFPADGSKMEMRLRFNLDPGYAAQQNRRFVVVILEPDGQVHSTWEIDPAKHGDLLTFANILFPELRRVYLSFVLNEKIDAQGTNKDIEKALSVVLPLIEVAEFRITVEFGAIAKLEERTPAAAQSEIEASYSRITRLLLRNDSGRRKDSQGNLGRLVNLSWDDNPPQETVTWRAPGSS
jgi:hypothetical protein